MKILLIAPVVPAPEAAGAIPILLHAQLEALRARHEITFVAGVGDEPGEVDAADALARAAGVEFQFGDRRSPSTGRRRWRRRYRLASTWVRRELPWRTIWFADPSVQRILDRLAATRSFDVIAVEDSSMGGLRLPAGVPSVLTEHEVHRPRDVDWRAGAPARWPAWAFRELDWRRWATSQRQTWSQFDRVQVFTERDARALVQLAPEATARVRVNPFGVVLPAAADLRREDPDTVLFVGNFTHWPNRDAAHWLACEIMPAVRGRHRGARLRIVGSAPPPEVRELAGPEVDVVADAPLVQPHVDAAAVIIAPVRAGGGMRLKVLHALASGKPVVTTSRGVEGYAGPGRIPPFVVADDAEGIAAATAQLLGDEPRRRKLGERGRAFALEHHSPEAWGSRLEAVYEEARAGRREPM